MKIAHIKQPDLLPPSETFIYQQLTTQTQNISSIALCHRQIHQDRFPLSIPIYQLDQRSLPVRCWNKLSYKLFRYYPYYDSIIRKEKPDLIHAHFGHTGYFARALAKKHQLPLLVSCYGIEAKTHLQTEFWQTRYQLLFQQADYFTCVSDWMKETLLRWHCPPEKLHVIRVGIDLDEFQAQEKHWDGNEPLRLLFVGRFHPEKGILNALRAVALVREKGFRNFRLLCIGSGPLEPAMQDLVKELDLVDCVEIRNGDSRKDILDAFQQCQLFVLPSLGESQGIVLQEAGACYAPVIASNIQGIPEGVRHEETGLLVAPEDPQALGEAILYFADQPERIHSFGLAGRKFVEKHFRASTMLQHYHQLYQTMLS